MSDSDEPTGVAPTQLGSAIEETEAHTAWSLEDYEEPVRLTPHRIVALAVIGAGIVIASAAGLVAWHLRSNPAEIDAAETSTVLTPPPVAAPPPAAAPPPPPPPAPETVTVTAPPPVTQTVAVPSDDHSESPNTNYSLNEMAVYDDRFIIAMRNLDWLVTERDSFVSKAHFTCTLLYNGMTPTFVHTKFVNETGLDMLAAQQFVSTAMAIYPDCP